MTPFREALIDAVIDGWSDGKSVGDVARKASVVSGEHQEDCYSEFRAAFGVQYVDSKRSIKTQLPNLSPAVNEMLWAGRKREFVQDALRKRFGGCVRNKGRVIIKARALTGHDWNVVK